MNNFFKRSLCVLCALLVAFTCAVRPHAITGVDDALIVGTSAVALLFLSWCGITFGTNADAVAGVQAYLENTVDGAKRLATIAEQYVADGTLKMTAAVKSAYMDLKDGIRKFFVSDTETGTGSVLSSGYVVGSPVQLGTSAGLPEGFSNMTNTQLLGYMPFTISMFYNAVFTYKGIEYLPSVSTNSDNTVSIEFRSAKGSLLLSLSHISLSDRFNIYWTGNSSSDLLYCFNVAGDGRFKYSSGALGANGLKIRPGTLDLLFTAGDVSFMQDKYIDGSSALKILEPVELPDPTPGQDPDPDNKPKEFPILPLETVVENGKSHKTDEQGNKVSEANPSLAPDELVETLRKLLEQAQPNPDPDPDPTTPDDSGDQYGKKHDAKWAEVFPFCVPFDLIEFLNVLAADPEAPHFTWKFDFGENLGQHELEIDLAPFDQVAQIVRTLELLAFCLGLILLTRNIIRG